MRKTLLATTLILMPTLAYGQANTVTNWQTGTTSSGAPINQPVSNANPLPVAATLTPSGTQNVNVQQVNGAAVNVGTGAAGTGTQRVTTSTDSTVGTVTNPVGVKGLDGATISGPFNPLPVLIVPSSSTGVTTQSCTVACASTIVTGGHGVYGLSASSTATGWILVYDATSCSANGTVTPKKAYAYTVANSTLGVSWSDSPMVVSVGAAVCFSTSGPYTATASTTAFLSVDYK